MEQVVLIPLPIDDFRAMVGETVRAELTTITAAAAPMPEPTADIPALLTRKDAAKYLGISLPTLHKYTQDGRLIAYKIGSQVRYKRHELEEQLTAMYQHKRRA